jgi:hypothetical protein
MISLPIVLAWTIIQHWAISAIHCGKLHYCIIYLGISKKHLVFHKSGTRVSWTRRWLWSSLSSPALEFLAATHIEDAIKSESVEGHTATTGFQEQTGNRYQNTSMFHKDSSIYCWNCVHFDCISWFKLVRAQCHPNRHPSQDCSATQQWIFCRKSLE